MDLQQLLASLLNPNGSQQAMAAPMGAAAQVGDHANPALLQQSFAQAASQQMPQAAPPAPVQAPQAPMGQPMQPSAPQAAPAPSGGGLGGFLQNIIAPQTAGHNKTVSWLTSQGIDPGMATVIASDKTALRQFILQRGQGQKPIEIAGKLVDPNTYKVLADFSTPPAPDKPTTDIQNYQFAIKDGYKGSFAQWKKDNGSGVTVNLPGAPNIGTIPPGYAAKQDPVTGAWTMEPIPGGPAAASAAADATTAANAKENQATASDVITSAASKIRTLAKEPGSTGIVGAGASYLPNTPAAELYRQVDVLKSNATIENLNAMRAASKTGGALGNVTEGEGKMLAAKSGALDPKSPYFLQQVDDYERTLLRIVHGKAEGDRIFDQSRQAPAPGEVGGPASVTPEGGRVIQNMTNPSPVVDWKTYFGNKAR